MTKWSKSEKENFDAQFEKSLYARYLIHVLGDVHQPLHASAFFDNDRFKNGDQGGNLYKIRYTENINQLHKLFDSGVNRLSDNLDRPLNSQANEYLTKTAEEIMTEFKKSELPEIKNADFSDWIQESHDVAQNFIYKNIPYDSVPSEDFLNSAFDMVKRRIALGGYRLAEIFKQIRVGYEKVAVEEKSEKSEKTEEVVAELEKEPHFLSDFHPLE